MSRGMKVSSVSTVALLAVLSAAGVYFAFFRAGEAPIVAVNPAPPVAILDDTPPTVTPAPSPAPLPLPAPAPLPPSTIPRKPRVDPSEAVRLLCADGKWTEALRKIGETFSGDISDMERTDLTKQGAKITHRLLRTSPDPKQVEVYEIRSGDSLSRIARRFKKLHGVMGSIMLVNNYRVNQVLRLGRKVRVPLGTWSILIDKSLFTLYCCYEGAPFKSYQIAIGTGEKTPASDFTVGTRNPKPRWYPPSGLGIQGPIEYGDATNPLGEYWVGIDNDFHHGLGIHGTNDPGSIGSKASNGCIRMRNKEVLQVAALAYRGMSVKIVE